VASGFLQENQFIAYEILAKHDENYMPVKIEVQN
jgi:cytochrome c-type biogenesis protein CcmE